MLPNKFEHFHSAWDSVEEEKKTLNRLSTGLMAEEIRIGLLGGTSMMQVTNHGCVRRRKNQDGDFCGRQIGRMCNDRCLVCTRYEKKFIFCQIY